MRTEDERREKREVAMEKRTGSVSPRLLSSSLVLGRRCRALTYMYTLHLHVGTRTRRPTYAIR